MWGGVQEFEQYAAHYHSITPHTSPSLEGEIGELRWTHVCIQTLYMSTPTLQRGRTCRHWRRSSWRRSRGQNPVHCKSQSQQLPPLLPTTCCTGQPEVPLPPLTPTCPPLPPLTPTCPLPPSSDTNLPSASLSDTNLPSPPSSDTNLPSPPSSDTNLPSASSSLATGGVFGEELISLRLLDNASKLEELRGVAMEITDMASPTVAGVHCTSSVQVWGGRSQLWGSSVMRRKECQVAGGRACLSVSSCMCSVCSACSHAQFSHTLGDLGLPTYNSDITDMCAIVCAACTVQIAVWV